MKQTIRALLAVLTALVCLASAASAFAERETLRFPDGTETSADAERLDLSGLGHEQVDATVELLGQMPSLRRIDLGADRAVTRLEQGGEALPVPERVWVISAFGYFAQQDVPAAETDEERLSWEDIRRIVEAAPQAEVEYRFHIGDLRFSTLSEEMDINHIRLDDGGALIRKILPCMRNLKLLDMDFCGVDSTRMAAIRDEYPGVEVIWRVWFGPDDLFSVRTDEERVLASSAEGLDDENIQELRWCTKVRYLDIGHNVISDLSFIRDMRDLEVLIVSLTNWRDLTPITGMEKLEFFEGCAYFGSGGYDISALGTCPNLRHVNICCLGEVTGYEALAQLHGLERLWIGYGTYIPDEWLARIREANPQAEINTTETTGCAGSWRNTPWGDFVPRYALLREQFGYDDFGASVAMYFNDPKYTYPSRGEESPAG